MDLDYDRFMEEGFLILPGFIEAEELRDLRLGFDVLVQLSQERSRQSRTASEPIGGAWQAASQPRVMVDQVVTEETGYVAEYFLQRPLEVSSQLLGAQRVGIAQFELMASAVWDYGATDWHRDYDSNSLAPLAGVQRDQQVNGPPYVQWNIALYEDDMFWVVPGSHVNADNEELKRQLLLDRSAEVPGAFQVRLQPGDGLVYASYILHWGSPYTSRMRRVIHTGYYDVDKISSFGHNVHYDMGLPFARHLSAASQERMGQMVEWVAEVRDRYAQIFRAALDKDRETFQGLLAAAHPELSCRLVALVHFCRLAERLVRMCGSTAAGLSAEEREAFGGGYADEFFADFGRRFSQAEADLLGERFAPMTAMMETDRDRSNRLYTEVARELKGPDAAPDFDSRALRTHYHQMPELTIDDLIASW